VAASPPHHTPLPSSAVLPEQLLKFYYYYPVGATHEVSSLRRQASPLFDNQLIRVFDYDNSQKKRAVYTISLFITSTILIQLRKRIPGFFNPAIRIRQGFGQYPRLTDGGHKIGVSPPTRHNVHMQVIRDTRTSHFPQV
jgi:hypothetical protein